MLVPDGFESAVIGVVRRFSDTFILLDEEKCIELLEADGMAFEEAIDYFEFIVIGAWMGQGTPAFLSARLTIELREEMGSDEITS